MQMDEGMDTGDILLERRTDIHKEETTAELWDRLAVLGAQTLIETLANLENITPQKQDHEQATYAPLITKDTGTIDWSRSASEIHNQIRGCVSWPVAHSVFRSKTIKIWTSRIIEEHSDALPGSVVALRPFPQIATGNGRLELLEIQLPSKKRTSADSLVNGFKLELGERLGEES